MKKTALSRVRSCAFDLSTTIQSISRSWPGSNGRSFLIVDFLLIEIEVLTHFPIETTGTEQMNRQLLQRHCIDRDVQHAGTLR